MSAPSVFDPTIYASADEYNLPVAGQNIDWRGSGKLMKDIRIGVLTFHRCINYGSYWQAKCLVEGLREKGYDAVLLDHDSRTVSLAEWKCGFRPTLPITGPRSDRKHYRAKVTRFLSRIEQLPLSRRFDLDDPSDCEPFDVTVVGSDEVWNLYHPWYGKRALFFGDGIDTRRLISYAASFGNYPAAYGLESPWTDKLARFDQISVRDENSRTIVRNTLGFDPHLVLDPCLAFPVNAVPAGDGIPDRPFAAVYGHNFSKELAESVRRWARSRNLPLVSIGYRNDWADEQWLSAGPHEFANFIAHASAVVTNFFHGCVFSLRNLKPFVCEAGAYRENKLTGLMKKVGAEPHLVDQTADDDRFSTLLDQPLNPSIPERIGMLRIRSEHYLNAALAA